MTEQDKTQGPVKKGGIVTDTSYLNQPPGTLTFALNAVNESETGDKGWISNEQSNEPCYTLPEGYVPIGEVYLGNNQTVVFSSSVDEQLSEIGITDVDCKYTTLVRTFLGFQVSKQIMGSYRLRRGCERILYFTTPVPMTFNIDKPEDFKTEGQWDIDKFKLFKIYENIPNFDTIEVLETGALPPGSYNAAIQYVDEDLNPTEWITTCEPIKIYNDSVSKNYETIEGATSIVDGITNFGKSNKAIKFTFSNFDPSYPLYRVAIIEANTGSGLVTAVNFSDVISTGSTSYTYTGLASVVTVGTEEEIIVFNNIIEEAKYIEQIENRLILGNTKGIQVNFCNIQKYASKIKANLELKEIPLNTISPSNPKTATINFDGAGYMPGEIYSFGIVYIFENSVVTPSYHIPGKALGYPSLMSDNNKAEDVRYQEQETCKNYWGLDSEGETVNGQLQRHHRFPSRAELNEPLYNKIKRSDPFTLNYLTLNIQGTPTQGTTLEYTVKYAIDNVDFTYDRVITVADYDDTVGELLNITSSRGVIIVTDILEGVDGQAQVSVGIFGAPSVATGVKYTPDIEPRELESDVAFYTSRVMGITFSGIEIPSLEDTNGHKIIGYYIVRNERTEEEKTILDSGVVVPMMDERTFVAHGHLFPNLADTSKIKKDIFALIHPEHKFKTLEYKNATEIVQEGEYLIEQQTHSSVVTQDVGAGSSYDPEVHKKGSADYDGFSLHTLTRDSEVSFQVQRRDFMTPFNKEKIFYLNTLNSLVVKDTSGERRDVYNVSGDNKIGIIQLNEDISTVEHVNKRLPYVIMKRRLSNPYSNFRVLPYFKESRNPTYFNQDPLIESDTTIFNGDSYITPMRYHSALFVDFRLKDRKEKKSIWKIIVGVLLIAAAATIAVLSLGTGAVASYGLVATGLSIAAAGYGISTIASGIEQSQMAKVYQEIYEEGLKDTIKDDDIKEVFGPNPSDDEFQWLSDTVTNLWFESSVNMALRHGATVALTDYLDAPSTLASKNGTVFSGGSFADSPQNALDSYILEKTTTIDSENSDGRLYRGYAGAELYLLNPDYERLNKQKVFFALGREYDCCSDCVEDFPQRTWYSEQSFQEELTDNYRKFLPNNYIDIEGEKGVITDIFRMQNSLYIHTEGALWHLPQNIQERVTGDVVSFIGTGSFFSIPPRKITDSDKASAGTSHNWGRMKTEHGTLFISETEGKIFLFNGESLHPLSSEGNDIWFKHNLPILSDKVYLTSAGVLNPLRNNPSNLYGTGFISAYDTQKERFIVTKKDLVYSDRITGSKDYNTCIQNGEFIMFDDYQKTIDEKALEGWSFEGVEYCRMRFSKTTVEQREETREVIGKLPSNAHVHYFLDTSGSFGSSTGECLESVRTAIQVWHSNLDNPNIQLFEHKDSTERWVNYAQAIQSSYGPEVNLASLDIVIISFCNEAHNIYHPSALQPVIGDPTSAYKNDYDKFVGTNHNGNNPSNSSVYNTYKSFFGVHYPIVFGTDSSDCNGGSSAGIIASKEFLSHSIAALVGRQLGIVEASEILTPQNLGFTNSEWGVLSSALQGVNNYPQGLENFGWVGKWDRHSVFGQPVISETQFTQDIDDLIKDNTTIVEEIVIVDVIVTTVEYVEGVIIDEPVDYNNSWTMSYSLKDREWVSWHSYIPNMYIFRLQEFFSWRYGSDIIWKHNKKDHYQTFYGEKYPHIIEYVDNKRPRETKVWDYLSLQTKAEQFNPIYEEYVDVDVTFNKVIAYTSKQTTGLLNLIPKVDGIDYLDSQVTNSIDSTPIDRNERDWTINDLRDIRTNYVLPLFRRDKFSLKNEYYIDKVLNEDAIDYSKDWYDLQSFRDKYLVLRLIFDNFDDIKLVTNFTEEMDNKSYR